MAEAALPYQEPDIVTILTLVSFLLLLNIINHVLDRLIYVGLLGHIFVGIAWATPGGNWLGSQLEAAVVNLGYLGLLLLVYQGGLTTSFRSLKANLWLSVHVAATGISLPIGLSYVLMVLVKATPLQAFAAGAALCSTSLGTTFTVMEASGLSTTRMGVVLTSAAMMDDVVGLVMVQVISYLGKGSSSFNAVTVVRPVFVSIAFALAVPVVCRFLVLPVTLWLNQCRAQGSYAPVIKLLQSRNMGFILHTTILVSLVTAASYAGASNLLAAYLAGVAISWWDSDVPHELTTVQHPQSVNRRDTSRKTKSPVKGKANLDNPGESIMPLTSTRTRDASNRIQSAAVGCLEPVTKRGHGREGNTGIAMFQEYCEPALHRLLKPFFFASIGFSVPITRMFRGAIIWRALVYTILMCIGKLACGLWLARPPVFSWTRPLLHADTTNGQKTATSNPSVRSQLDDRAEHGPARTSQPSKSSTQQASASAKLHSRRDHQTPNATKPVSLYPAAIVGCAMVARGEIGFLISSIAESNGIFGKEKDSPLFLIVTWAIMLCTIIGPICVGLMVKRLKKLDGKSMGSGRDRRDVLGVWGFELSAVSDQFTLNPHRDTRSRSRDASDPAAAPSTQPHTGCSPSTDTPP